MTMTRPVLVGTTYHARWMVPTRLTGTGKRAEAKKSLRTDSLAEAAVRLPAALDAMRAEWEARAALREGEQVEAYRAAARLAGARGFAYRTSRDLATGDLGDILARLDAAGTPEDEAALLGKHEQPPIMLSQLFDEIERISAHRNRYKSPDALRVWAHAKRRAAANLLAALGRDIPVLEITAAHARRHRAWWKKRLAAEGLRCHTANKDFTNMAAMLRDLYEDLETPDPPRPYSRISIIDPTAETSRKPELPSTWIRETLLAPATLASNNDEMRSVVMICAELGTRQTEITRIPPSAICLDGPYPHIWIRNEPGDEQGRGKRQIKNLPSKRVLPLVGIAHAAFRRHPAGFSRYRDKSGFSNAANDALRSLFPPSPEIGKNYTIGGVRHTYESRLKGIRLHNDDRAEMMGHGVASARNRELYGDAMPLARRTLIARAIAWDPPDHLLVGLSSEQIDRERRQIAEARDLIREEIMTGTVRMEP